VKSLYISQTLKRSGCLAVAFLLLNSLSMAQPTSPVGDTAGVTNVGFAFAKAWNTHDMDALAGLFATDADFVNVVGQWWHGREAIHQAHAQIHQTIFKASTLVIDSTAVRFLSPDFAIAHIVWTLTGHLTPEGVPGPPRHGILSFVMKHQEKIWLVQSAQNTDIIPGVATIPQEQQKPGK